MKEKWQIETVRVNNFCLERGYASDSSNAMCAHPATRSYINRQCIKAICPIKHEHTITQETYDKLVEHIQEYRDSEPPASILADMALETLGLVVEDKKA